MLSLGMVIGAIFNQGKSLINGQHSNSAYMKQLEVVSQMEKNYKIEKNTSIFKNHKFQNI